MASVSSLASMSCVANLRNLDFLLTDMMRAWTDWRTSAITLQDCFPGESSGDICG
jgi:hypothetical protein